MRIPLTLLALNLVMTSCTAGDAPESDLLPGTLEAVPADALHGKAGPSTAHDNSSSQVWNVSRKWSETDSAAGMAWSANSGLTWDEKFTEWVDSMPKSGSTFSLTTPFGRSFDAPNLECAETAMFLRIAFASWYELPFFMEATNGGKRVFFGHMGIINADGTKWNNMPNFKSSYEDYSHLKSAVIADPSSWPSDSRLRGRKIAGSAGDEQKAFGGAHAGTYFDEIFLNKRVGYFLNIQLSYMGSISLADPANTYNVKSTEFREGDFLVERFAGSGIGHTVVIKEVRETATTVFVGGEEVQQRDVELMSGSMPRRQAQWEDAASAIFTFESGYFGGWQSVEFGAGLKRFRTAEIIGGKWTNNVLDVDNEDWLKSSDYDTLVERLAEFGLILREIPPEERLEAYAAQVEVEREHLRKHPASCSARSRRERVFQAIYDTNSELGYSREETDILYREMEDYVLAELSYTESKTCCWNTSNEEMYFALMEYNYCLMGWSESPTCAALADEDWGMCQPARVFKARNDGSDGYKRFADFAALNHYDWKAWEANEECPQANTVAEDVEVPNDAVSVCALYGE